MVAKNGFAVIDADGHIIEPRGMWEQYIDPEFRDQAPRSTTPLAVMVGDKHHPTHDVTFGSPEGTRAVINNFRAKFGEDLISTDPADYLKAMDLEGIDRAVLYPSQGLFAGWDDDLDPRLAAAIARAYNNWLYDFCGGDRQRLHGAGMITLQDVDLACQEAVRAVKDLGMKALFVRPNPVLGRTLDNPAYDPLYATIQDLGVPLATHEGTGTYLPVVAKERWSHVFFAHITSHALETMLACLAIVGGGVCEKFPNLKVAFLEAGAGWVPYWLERMDEHYEGWLRPTVPWLKMKPSEYFMRQCYVGADAGDETLPWVIQAIGDQRILWASDYPHPDAKFPRAVEATLDLVDDGLPEESLKRILSENAAALYGFKN